MSHAEIFQVATNPKLAESGGGHNQKGINFQRVWAIARMVELDEADSDFLMLFEAIQDLAEFDSEQSPQTVRVYQVKKKDGGTWSWNELTNLYKIDTAKAKKQALGVVEGSPLGKLYQSVIAFNAIKSTGHFASNMGCDLPLLNGGNAATSSASDLSMLDAGHLKRLSEALATLHTSGNAAPSRLHVMKIPIHPDAPEKALIGVVFKYLQSKSPSHAGQASSLVEALLAIVAPLSGKTDACHDFAQLRKQRGFSRQQFQNVLGTLEQVPDVKGIVIGWIDQLPDDGSFNAITRARMKVHVAAIFQMRLASKLGSDDAAAVSAFDTYLADNPVVGDLLGALKQARTALLGQFPGMPQERFCAHFLMRAAEQCVDQT